MTERSVHVEENGRSGVVRYREAAGELSFYWELGGGDAVAVVQVGNEAEWRRSHEWAVERRAEILRFVGDELVRQQAPRATAELDDAGGWLVLRQRAGAPPPSVPAKSFMEALRTGRSKLALAVGAVALVAAVLLGLGKQLMTVDPGKGAPLGPTIRTDAHLATLVQTLEPYTASLARDPGRDRYRVGVLLVPLAGGEPRFVPLAEGLPTGQLGLARVLGSDGRSLWYDVNGTGAVDLGSFERLSASALAKAGPLPSSLAGSRAIGPPPPDAYLCAGLFVDEDSWLGLHATDELEREYQPGKYVRRIVRAGGAKAARRVYVGALGPASDGRYYPILSMTPAAERELHGAAFLRLDDASEPLRLTGPDGALMVHSSGPELACTLVVARVDLTGAPQWSVDTGIDRFTLQQILPGERSTAFVGTRPRIPDQVPEPIVVLVDHGTGAARTQSLWR